MMPNLALLSISNAAIYGLVQALMAELRAKPQRINEVKRVRSGNVGC